MKRDTTLGGYAWVNTVGSEKGRKKASSAIDFKSETKCPRCKWYLQNESRRAFRQKFIIVFFFFFLPRLCYGLSKLSKTGEKPN